MKKIIMVITATLLLTACAAHPAEVTLESEPQSVPVSESANSLDSEESSEDTEPSDLESEPEEDTEIGGSYDSCEEHIFSYHSVILTLINYVGQENFNNWANSISAYDEYGRPQEDFTISAFIEHFQIPREDFEACIQRWASDERMEALGAEKEDYLAEYGYTDEQIDALYSGDQAEINRAFCGEMAYYNEADGQLYSVYWLSDHTAEDYAEAGLPETEIERILDLASSSGGSYAALAREAASAAAAYASLVEESAE